MCLLLCPITYERFTSGRYYHQGDSHHNNHKKTNDLLLLGETTTMENEIGTTTTTTENSVVVATTTTVAAAWHTQKKRAEHGAAARAYDCLIYREHMKLIHHSFGGVLQDQNKKEKTSNKNDDDSMDWHSNNENHLKYDNSKNNESNNKQMEQALANARPLFLGAEIPYATPDEGPIVTPPPEVEAAIQAQIQHWKNARKDKKRQRQEEQMLVDEDEQAREQARQDYIHIRRQLPAPLLQDHF
jgi:hypothetical protein